MNPSNQYYYAITNIIRDCIDNYLMSKEETARYLQVQHRIRPQDTNIAWDFLERANPGSFVSYNARIHERNARTRVRVASTSSRVGEQEQQRRVSPPRRSLLPDLNAPAYGTAVYPSIQAGLSNANAMENQNLQASQQLVIPNAFCQQVLNTLGQLQSNSDHIIKLLTDGTHGPLPSAAGSLKRQRVGEAEVRRGNEEAEKQQENEEGNIEEAEKQQ